MLVPYPVSHPTPQVRAAQRIATNRTQQQTQSNGGQPPVMTPAPVARPTPQAQAARQNVRERQIAAEREEKQATNKNKNQASVSQTPLVMSLLGPIAAVSPQRGETNRAAGNSTLHQTPFAFAPAILAAGVGTLLSPVERAVTAIAPRSVGISQSMADQVGKVAAGAPLFLRAGAGTLLSPAEQATAAIAPRSVGISQSMADQVGKIAAGAPLFLRAGAGTLLSPAEQATMAIAPRSVGVSRSMADQVGRVAASVPLFTKAGAGTLLSPAKQATRASLNAADGPVKNAASGVSAMSAKVAEIVSQQIYVPRTLSPSFIGIGLGAAFTPVDQPVRAATGKSPVAEIPQFYKTHPDAIAKGVALGAAITGGIVIGSAFIGGGGGAAASIATRSGVSTGGAAAEFATATGTNLAEDITLLAASASPILTSDLYPTFPTGPQFPTDNAFPKSPGPEQEVIVDRSPEIVQQITGKPSRWEPGAAEIGNTAGISMTTRGAPKNPIGTYERIIGGREIASPEISPSESAWKLGNAELLQGKRAEAGFKLSEAIPSPFPTGPAPGFPDIFPTFPGGPRAIDEDDEDLLNKPKPAVVPDITPEATPDVDQTIAEIVRQSFVSPAKIEIKPKVTEVDLSNFASVGGNAARSRALSTGISNANTGIDTTALINTIFGSQSRASANAASAVGSNMAASTYVPATTTQLISMIEGPALGNPPAYPPEFPDLFLPPEPPRRRNTRKGKRTRKRNPDTAGFSFFEYSPLPKGFNVFADPFSPRRRTTKKRGKRRARR